MLTGRRREARSFIRAARRRGDSYRVAPGRAGVPPRAQALLAHGGINIDVKMHGNSSSADATPARREGCRIGSAMCALRASSVGRRVRWQHWMADALWEMGPDAPAMSTRESSRATAAACGFIARGGEHALLRR